MDRNELIKLLGDAFTKPETEKPDTPQSTVESAVVGEKDVLRLITNKDNINSLSLLQEHPEVYFVEHFVNELQRTNQSDINLISRELIIKFNDAVDHQDSEKIEKIIQVSKENFLRLHAIDITSPERALANLLATDAIKNI